MTTLAAAVAAGLPGRLVGSVAVALYPRFEPELRRLADFCPPGGVALDIGGWYGPWSRRLAARCERVVTVEPVPHLAEHLRRTLPSNVRVVQGAATDREGTARLWFPEGDQGDRGVSSLARRAIHAHSVEVPSVTVDGLGLTGVGFVKMDVDGGEAAALLGAAELLRRDRPALLIELEGRLGPIEPVIATLTGLGYAGWVLPHRDWLPLTGFDLVAHQERTEHLVHRGVLHRAFAPRRERYVNSVLFLPEGRTPGTV
ncbi:FkbM family methyltransferase [Streptomyces sp. YPW6]|uniref:FkbM family methyltransferase n=1 Tax=Streptomyces sp. YPW6 TaxID=2840373 RepID=UPI001C0CDB7A|nr:FkbM family methyltransferase [Streptomyces sp. YPW6]QWQ44952.1 FkbM family methyltransferase [Streptomyces sp. YPW6]